MRACVHEEDGAFGRVPERVYDAPEGETDDRRIIVGVCQRLDSHTAEDRKVVDWKSTRTRRRRETQIRSSIHLTVRKKRGRDVLHVGSLR